MTIEIHKPELEALIKERMTTRGFHSVEDALLDALKSSHSSKPVEPAALKPKKNLAEFIVESPLRDSGLRLDRQKDYPRPVEL